MNITYEETLNIFKTLPIGYYLGYDIPTELSKENDSYYDSINKKIVISFPLIERGVENMKEETEEYDKEMAIRSMLYHEISHVLLTPVEEIHTILSTIFSKDSWLSHEENNLLYHVKRCGLNKDTMFQLVNIFEDERIETILNDYYMSVNFKKNIYYICDGVTEPTDMMSLFFNAIRFNSYDLKNKGDVLKTKFSILKKYGEVNTFPLREDSLSTRILSIRYLKDIVGLYEMMLNEVKEKSEDIGTDGEPIESTIKTLMDMIGSGESTKTDDVYSDEIDSIEIDVDGYAKIDTVDKETTKSMIKNLVEKMTDEVVDVVLYNTFDEIINSFNKKSGGGNSLMAYSGIINPRQVGRSDYRYFEKMTSLNGNNSFGSLHLNLFLDDSGSYCRNEQKTNEIIRALNKLEEKHKNFSLDVYFVAEGIFHAETPKDRMIRACKGNWLVKEIFPTFRKAQKTNTFNYNIVLFDGNAFSADVNRSVITMHEEDKQNFRAFDTNNTTIISDPYNKRFIDGVVKSAKVVYSSNFVRELSANITNALVGGFR